MHAALTLYAVRDAVCARDIIRRFSRMLYIWGVTESETGRRTNATSLGPCDVFILARVVVYNIVFSDKERKIDDEFISTVS